MRVAVIGAGAIGGVLAAAAADAGHEVTLRVRTPFDVLVVTRDGHEVSVPASVSSEPVGPPADVVFVTVKATDTAGVEPHLATLCGDSTVTVVVQNGLGHVARVTPYVPPDSGPVVPAIAYIAAEQVAPGRIEHAQSNVLRAPADHAPIIAEALGEGIRVRGTDDFATEAWRKLLANLLGNPITAITLRRMDVMHDPGIPELARRILDEAVAVARAEGVHFSDDEVAQVLEGIARLPGDIGSSMLFDRQAGRPMEHQFLTGEVVRRGAEHGIDVPVNSTLLALLDAIDVTSRA